VLDIGISKDADGRPERHGAWNAWTGKTCATGSWYHSGWPDLETDELSPRRKKSKDDKPKDKDVIGQPCIWMGGYGVKSAQFHLPSHTMPQNVTAINSTVEASHDHFCNSPAKMSFWEDGPQRSEMIERLNLKIHDHGTRSLQETRDRAKGKKFGGKPDPKRIADRAIHDDVLSIGHLNRPGFLAEELCSHGTSEGPDWVNEHEGKFCDMATRTLYDVCTEDLRDNCFDMGLKDVVKNGVVKRAMPYSSENHFPPVYARRS